MEIDGKFRRRIKHFDDPYEAHLYTFTTYNRHNAFRDESPCRMLSASIMKARQLHGFHLWAYVFMPDHIHLLIYYPMENYSSASVLRSIKQPVSQQYFRWLRTMKLNEADAYRATGKKPELKFWQEGPGHDENIRNAQHPWSSVHAWNGGVNSIVTLDLEFFPYK
jgi:putative transposase